MIFSYLIHKPSDYKKNNLSEKENRKIALSSKINLVLLLISSLYIPIFFFVGHPILSWYLIPLDIGFFVCAYLNRTKKYALSKIGMLFLGNLAAFFYSMLLGEPAGAQLLFFAFIGIPILIFMSRDIFIIFCLSFLSFFGYALLLITDYTLLQNVGLTQIEQKFIHYSAFVSTFIIIILYLRFLLTSFRDYEENLITLNRSIQNTNDKLLEKQLDLENSNKNLQEANKKIKANTKQELYLKMAKGIQAQFIPTIPKEITPFMANTILKRSTSRLII